MKKIFLLMAFALTVSVANAWVKQCDEAVVLVATKHLTPKAMQAVESYLGKSYADDVHYLYTLERKKTPKYSKEVHYVHLNSDLQSVEGSADDALLVMEQSVALIRAYENYTDAEIKEALRIVINLMCDAHNLSYFRVDGVEHSQKPFKFVRKVREYGKNLNETAPVRWATLWSNYCNRHRGFSSALWAEDIELCLGGKFAEYSEGTLREWILQNGAKSASYLAYINPSYVMPVLEFQELEDVNYEMMARAGFRLAALLNDIFK